jgi:hypothetical protein
MGVEYTPTELGVDTSASRPLTVALDDDVHVVVVGWDDETPEDDPFVIEQANGTALAELATTVDQAYADVFAARFVAGEDPAAIVADVPVTRDPCLDPPPHQFGSAGSPCNGVRGRGRGRGRG